MKNHLNFRRYIADVRRQKSHADTKMTLNRIWYRPSSV